MAQRTFTRAPSMSALEGINPNLTIPIFEDKGLANLPTVFVLHLFAVLAEKERPFAKARGVTLGNPRLNLARKSAVGTVTASADRFAANVLPIIREAQKAGAITLREIAAALNARGSRRLAVVNGTLSRSATSLSAHRRTNHAHNRRNAAGLSRHHLGCV